MLHLSAIMEEVSKLFAENDTQTPCFKRTSACSSELYGDLSLRTCSDLDLLVPLDDLEQGG